MVEALSWVRNEMHERENQKPKKKKTDFITDLFFLIFDGRTSAVGPFWTSGTNAPWNHLPRSGVSKMDQS